ncbi:MAG TPA: hypothetical protein VHB77_07920, partial [Planctomycetaceae bacterium]|nr:hypothetical protein [Planctomycetaceae bacterium]
MKTLAGPCFACACFAMTVVCVLPIQAQDPAKVPKPIAQFAGHAAEITTLAFSADGSRVATVSSDRACIWDPSTGREINRLNSAPYSVLAVSPDLRRLAIGGSFHVATPGALNGKLTLLECDSGKTLWSVNPHGDWDQKFPFRPSITALAFSPDGKRLIASGSMTKVGGRHGLPAGAVKLWNAETGELIWERDRLSTRADAVVFSPDGRYVAGATGGAGGELPEPGEVFVMNAA